MSVYQKAPMTAPERAYQWLRAHIAHLPWNQESFLSENNIAESTGVSRTPVREALLRLEAEGLIRRVPHKGIYIPAMTESDIDEMMEVRQVIGEWATRRITSGGSQVVEVLQELLEQQRESTDDPVKFIELDIAFHKAIVQAANNSTLEQVYDSQRVKQERVGIQAVLATAQRYEAVLHEHEDMLSAIKSGDPDLAQKSARRHIHSTRDAIGSRKNY
ncbi:GntR family transcriptional regulator [Glutamicibacter sp.]|uniref:GntR family transcriptional regulator n=1 Tax=Glutamicibacter sp. TaxID=1931995 RepID=UPI0028BD5940|nr:GntR family transcriptional regulator [Glutamicibacter sp.]